MTPYGCVRDAVPGHANGRVVLVDELVVDAEFPPNELPKGQRRATDCSSGVTTSTTCEVATASGSSTAPAVALKPTDGLVRGVSVTNTGEPIKVPVGEGVLGTLRVGEPLDMDPSNAHPSDRWAIHREAPPFAELEPKKVDADGIKVIELLEPDARAASTACSAAPAWARPSPSRTTPPPGLEHGWRVGVRRRRGATCEGNDLFLEMTESGVGAQKTALVFGQMDEPPACVCAWRCRPSPWPSMATSSTRNASAVRAATSSGSPRRVRGVHPARRHAVAVGYEPNLAGEMADPAGADHARRRPVDDVAAGHLRAGRRHHRHPRPTRPSPTWSTTALARHCVARDSPGRGPADPHREELHSWYAGQDHYSVVLSRARPTRTGRTSSSTLGIDELSEEDKCPVASRARKSKLSRRQPFFVAVHRHRGKNMPIDETIRFVQGADRGRVRPSARAGVLHGGPERPWRRRSRWTAAQP